MRAAMEGAVAGDEEAANHAPRGPQPPHYVYHRPYHQHLNLASSFPEWAAQAQAAAVTGAADTFAHSLPEAVGPPQGRHFFPHFVLPSILPRGAPLGILTGYSARSDTVARAALGFIGIPPRNQQQLFPVSLRLDRRRHAPGPAEELDRGSSLNSSLPLESSELFGGYLDDDEDGTRAGSTGGMQTGRRDGADGGISTASTYVASNIKSDAPVSEHEVQKFTRYRVNLCSRRKN